MGIHEKIKRGAMSLPLSSFESSTPSATGASSLC